HFGHAAGAAHPPHLAVADQGDAGRVVAAVFEALEPFDQDRNHVAIRDRANDAAHVSATPCSVRQVYGKALSGRTGEVSGRTPDAPRFSREIKDLDVGTAVACNPAGPLRIKTRTWTLPPASAIPPHRTRSSPVPPACAACPGPGWSPAARRWRWPHWRPGSASPGLRARRPTMPRACASPR